MTDLSALKDFLVLCQTKSFSRAAERCHLSVSGLSRRIQGLELWLGTPVFDRCRSALELTDAGRQLQSVAAEVVYALEGVKKTVQTEQEQQALQIRFAAPHIMSVVFFPTWIPQLYSDFRKAKFSVSSDNLPECFQALDAGNADFVVTLLDRDEGVIERLGLKARFADYPSLAMGEETLIPVCAPDAANRPMFNLERPRSEPLSFLGYAEECALGWALNRALLAWPGLKLQRHHQSNLADGLRSMALARLGIAWLPATMVRSELATRALVRAGGARFDVALNVVLIRRALRLADQADQFWRYVSELAARPAAEAVQVQAIA